MTDWHLFEASDEGSEERPVTWSWDQPPPPPAPHRRRRGRSLVALVVAALVFLVAGLGVGWSLRGTRSHPTSAPSAATTDHNANPKATIARVNRAVVDINTVMESPIGGPFGGPSRAQAAGTGILLTSSGEILTNNHVIEGATSINVTVAGRGTFDATVLGADPSADVALLQIQGSRLPTVSLGDSSSVSTGQQVVAIGNALGQGGAPTVTRGTISAVGRSITVSDGRGGSEHLPRLLQTDAQISPGDSGGPLVDASGRVIGIITASARSDFGQTSSNVGFAIPVNRAMRIVGQIRSGSGSPSIVIGQAGFLGVEVRDLDAAIAQQLGLGVSRGALIVGRVPGGPAVSAGIPVNSVITAVNGTPVGSADALGPTLHRHKPGDAVTVTWVDRHGTHTTLVTLTTGPAV
jgi:S1-C subfamily serine protease